MSGQGFLDVFGVPLCDLPPDVGMPLIAMARRLLPWQTKLLEQIRDMSPGSLFGGTGES